MGTPRSRDHNPYLDPEVFYDTASGGIVGYAVGTLGGSSSDHPACDSRTAGVPVGLRAESLTPIGVLPPTDIRTGTSGRVVTNLATNPAAQIADLGRRMQPHRSTVRLIFVTDGDDTAAATMSFD